jgi:hypothetical protein
LGYFLGYSGSGNQSDSYFKIDKKGSPILFCENSIIWRSLQQNERDLLYKTQDYTTQDLDYDEKECFWDIKEKNLNAFKKIEKDYYFETRDFETEILNKLCSKWSLLTDYN